MALGCGCVPWTNVASGCLHDVLSAMGTCGAVPAFDARSLLLDSLKMGAHGKGQTRGRYPDACRLNVFQWGPWVKARSQVTSGFLTG